MLVKELRQKVTDAGGSIVTDNAVIYYTAGGDVDVKTKGLEELVAWIGSSYNEDGTVEKNMSVANEIFDRGFKALIDFAQLVGVDCGVSPITVEKDVLKVQEVMKVDVESKMESSKLRGMVDAYEKIILGRDITVGK
jgi:hypothetical protein